MVWTTNFIYTMCCCLFRQSGATVEDTTGELGSKDTSEGWLSFTQINI